MNKIYFKLAVVLCFLIFTAIIFGQDSKSLLGQTAPNLAFSKILNYSKPSAQLSDFESKIIILDFWATWCAPCVASLPHLEKIQKKYADKIQIVTVTDESEERIRLFLRKKNFKLPVVFDSDKKLADAFPFNTLPHTIIIDEQNIVRAVTDSSKITDELLDKLLAKQQIALAEKKDDLNFDASQPLSGRANFLYQATLTPYQNGVPSQFNIYKRGTSAYLNRRILAVNVGLQELYEIAYEFPTFIRTVIEVKDKAAFKWSEQNAFCYDLIVPEEIGGKRFSIMRQQLDAMFPFRAVIEERDVPVKIVRKISGGNIKLTAAVGGENVINMSGKGLSMKNAPIKNIADFLQMMTNKIVLDETGISGNYDLEIPYYFENPAKINEELKKIGLETIEETRRVEMLVIYNK